mgnify:FL=1|tara:strand:+ start:1977 stop:2420 length:444 start_codon:yes stop_codon:yes gene_type:complete
MIRANIILDYAKWRKSIKNPQKYLKKKLQKLSKIPFFCKKNQEFSVLLTSDKKMKNLNLKFRKKNNSTDVLSFPSKNFLNVRYIGDIAISYETIYKRSKFSNFSLEFDKMWIHGYFHLNGYDHKKLKDFKNMSKKEDMVLKYFHQIN